MLIALAFKKLLILNDKRKQINVYVVNFSKLYLYRRIFADVAVSFFFVNIGLFAEKGIGESLFTKFAP